MPPTLTQVEENAFATLPEIVMVVLHVWASLPQGGDVCTCVALHSELRATFSEYHIPQIPIEKGIAFAEVNKSDLRQAVGRILDPLIAGHPGSLLRAFIVHLATLLEVYMGSCVVCTISHLYTRERLNR